MTRDALLTFSFLFTIFSFLFVQYYRREIDTNRQRLDSANDRRIIKKQLQQTASTDSYIRSVRRLESIFHRLMGPKTSGQAFLTIFGMAMIYPILAMYAAWLLGASTTELEAHFVSEGSLLNRGSFLGGELYRALNILLFPAIAFYIRIITMRENTAKWIIEKIPLVDDKEFALFMLSIPLGLAALLYVRYMVPGSYSNMISMLLVYSIMTAGSLYIVYAMFAFLPIPFRHNDAHSLVHFQLLSTFFILLPACNAIVDFVSWALTRYFLRSIADQKGRSVQRCRIMFEVFLDVTAAMLCLLLLVALMANAIAFSNIIAAYLSIPAIPWQEYLYLALNDPWGDGIFVNLMIVSTLLPTFIHLTFGVGGLIASLQPNFGNTAKLITIGRKNQTWTDLGENSKTLTERDQVARLLVFRQIWVLGAAVPVGIALIVLWMAFASLLNYFQFGLGSAAICSTAWSHGHCPILW